MNAILLKTPHLTRWHHLCPLGVTKASLAPENIQLKFDHLSGSRWYNDQTQLATCGAPVAKPGTIK